MNLIQDLSLTVGEQVYLGSLDIETAIDQIKPDIYFELSAVNRDGRRSRLRRLKECDVTNLIMDTEGSAFGNTDDFRPRVSEEIFAHTDYYCAWGSKSANIAQEQNKTSDVRIEITGNPRFDMLQKPYNEVYTTEAKEITNTYGDFILFNTNFSINHVDLNYSNKMALTDPTEKYRKQTRLIGEFTSAVGALAEEIQGHDIIVRPHPIEDPSLYKRLFTPYENVHVDKEGEVRPWILASDAVVHNSCTTGVTAALLGIPVFAYLPQNLAFSSVPNDVSTKCRTLPELIEKVTIAVTKDEAYEMNDEQVSELKPYIDNVDYVSAERIADIVESIDHEQPSGFNNHFSPPPKHRLKRLLVRTIGSDRFGPIYYERLRAGGSTNYKFSKTTISEMKSLVNTFPESVVPDKLNIDVVPGTVYTFKFHRNN